MTYDEWRGAHPVAAEVLRFTQMTLFGLSVLLIVWAIVLKGDGADAARTHVPGHTNLDDLEPGLTPVWMTVDGRRLRCVVAYDGDYRAGYGLSCDWSKR